MRIDELDEFQGVTPQLVADWMTQNGWKQTKPNWWARGEDGLMFDPQTFDQLWFWLKGLADVYESGNQLAMLRKINPRMRPGWPSERALAVHQMWIVSTRGNLSIGRYVPVSRELFSDGNDVSCWPCDNHGNKVRWPTDAKGNML